MEIEKIRLGPGRILYCDQYHILLAAGRSLLCSMNSGKSWEPMGCLSVTGWRDYFAGNRLGRRLVRAGVHHLAKISGNEWVGIANKDFFFVDISGKQFRKGDPVIGSRPLNLESVGGNLFYGEYRSNNERSVVSIWKSEDKANTWKAVWQFNTVRHVHGVFFDKFADSWWVTTGDYGDEAAIWKSDDSFRSLHKVVGGAQQFRAIDLVFTERYVFFGTDSPDDPNYICRINRKDFSLERLKRVGGPVFHGTSVGGFLFFSTAVEPSDVNTDPHAVIWYSKDGENWRELLRFRKDRWAKKYFQYGQVLFPAGKGDGRHLWITPFATEWDQQVLRIPLSMIDENCV
jgi:hypothetical protein